MNFGHHYFIRKALLCLLGWGIFLVPVSGWGAYKSESDIPKPAHAGNKSEVDANPDNSGGEEASPSQPTIEFKKSEFAKNSESNLTTYDTLARQLAENRKKMEALKTWQAGPLTEKAMEEKKKALEEERETIEAESYKILLALVRGAEKLTSDIENKIAPEDKEYFKELKKRLTEFAEQHKSERRIAELLESTEKQIEENKQKPLPKKKTNDLKKTLTEAEHDILNYLEGNRSLNELHAAKLEKYLENIRDQQRELEKLEAKSGEYDSRHVSSSFPTRTTETFPKEIPIEPKETPESTKNNAESEPKPGSTSSPSTSSSSSSTSSSGSRASSANTNRGSVEDESSPPHATDLPKNPEEPVTTARRVAEGQERIDHATSFGAGAGGPTQPEMNTLRPAPNNAAGTVASYPTLAATPTNQPQSAGTRPAASGGSTTYNIINNGDSKPATAAASTNPTVAETQTGVAGAEGISNDPSGLRPFNKPAPGAKPTANSREALAYAPSTGSQTTYNNNTQINIGNPTQPTQPQESREYPKTYSLNAKGELVPADPNSSPQRGLAASEESARQGEFPATEAERSLAQISAETKEDISNLKTQLADKQGTIGNPNPEKPEPSIIDKFAAAINDGLRPGKSELEEILNGKKRPKPDAPTSLTKRGQKPKNLFAETKASSAQPSSFFDDLKQAWNKLWN